MQFVGNKLKGLCSGFLQSLQPNQRCRVFVRPSSFRLPTDLSVPVIMIGPGTGIAPMRAILQVSLALQITQYRALTL
jgi:NADPH-ferrihemoprotein reductase